VSDKNLTEAQIMSKTMAVATVEKDMRPCEAVCPKHGVQCKLKMFEQDAFPMHAHMIDQKMCTWKK
jgi:hypothetical protein